MKKTVGIDDLTDKSKSPTPSVNLPDNLVPKIRFAIKDIRCALIELLKKANTLFYRGDDESCDEMFNVADKLDIQLDTLFVEIKKNNRSASRAAIEIFLTASENVISQARKNEALIVHRHLFMEGIRQFCNVFGSDGPKTDRIVKVCGLADRLKDLRTSVSYGSVLKFSIGDCINSHPITEEPQDRQDEPDITQRPQC
jgi:dsDNA-binding SOS-regulon protein